MDQKRENLLINLMQKEVRLMREILSNLLHEETLLQKHDQISRQKLTQERQDMLKTVESLRKERESHPMDSIKLSSEILLLVEQLSVLLDKTNQQKERNQTLDQNLQSSLAISKTFPYAHELNSQNKAKPIQLMLMDESNP